MLPGLHIIGKQLANLLLIILLLLAGSAYWLTYTVEHKQAEISDWLTQTLGYPVELGLAQINWSGLSPQLLLHNVSILTPDSQESLLSLEQLFLELDMSASFWQQDIRLDDMTLSGLKLTVIRNGMGQLSLQGLNTQGDSTPLFASLLVRSRWLNSFHLQDITLDYIDQERVFLSGRYQLDQAVVINRNQRWQAEADFVLPASLGKKVSVAADWAANDHPDWQWTVEADSLVSDAFHSYLTWQGVELQQARFDAIVSGQGKESSLNELDLELAVTDAKLISQKKVEPVLIDQLNGRFHWLAKEDEWSLTGEQIRLRINGNNWPETTFFAETIKQSSLVVNGQYLNLGDVTALASLLTDAPEMISRLKPAGDINQFSARYSFESGLQELALEMSEVAVLPWQEVPGVTGLTANLNWQNSLLSLDFDSRAMTLYPEQWLQDAVFFDVVTGRIQFAQHHDGWKLQSDGLRIWNEDLDIQLDGSLSQQGDKEIQSAMSVKLEQIAVNQWQKYVPQKVLNPNFQSWADKAFVDGKIVTGHISLDGDISAYPFQGEANQDKGAFEIALQVDDLQLHYAEGWPDIVGVNGTITGTGNDLIIQSQQGKIAGFDFVQVTTRIDKLVEQQPLLTVEGALNGTTQQAIDFLSGSPLRQRFANVTDAIEAQGASKMNLQLTVPLAEPDSTEVKGNVSLENSKIYSKSSPDLAITDAKGVIAFSDKSISAKGITATFLGNDVLIDVVPAQNETVIQAAGKISAKGIEDYLLSSSTEFMSGQTDYQLAVYISEQAVGEFLADVEFKSDLAGLELTLPAPLMKSAKQRTPISLRLDQNHNKNNFFIEYAEQATLSVQSTTQSKKVSLKLEKLLLDDWLSWSEHYVKDDIDFFTVNDEITLQTTELVFAQQQLSNAVISAKRQQQGWKAAISSDQSVGSITLATGDNDKQYIELELDRLAIQFAEDGRKEDKTKLVNTTLWPTMAVDIAALSINDNDLGHLRLKAKQEGRRWSVSSASLRSDNFTAIVNEAVWQQSNQSASTRIKLKANSVDLAKTLTQFGYQQAIDASRAKLDMELEWPGGPLNMEPSVVRGSLDFAIGKGKLRDVEAGAAGKVFGLMSIAALPRRLTLDFNDLFGKGLNFRTITGNFSIAGGYATTDNLVLSGDSAIIEVTGPVDIVNQRYDQKVKIIPNVSSTLPVAGAVAGGPVGLGIGAAILLADKLAGRLFNKDIINVIHYSYYLQGSWQEPELSLIKSPAN